MNFLRRVFDTSYELSQKDPTRSPVFVYCKLVEEISELSDVYHGIAASEPLNGEIADVIISALDLLYLTEYHDVQHNGSMTKDEIFDSMLFALSHTQRGECDNTHHTLEEDWFIWGVDKPIKNLAYITHYQGRVTRLLNQPQRSDDDMVYLINKIIHYTGRMAVSAGAENLVYPNETSIKVEQAFAFKVNKWRGKFGL